MGQTFFGLGAMGRGLHWSRSHVGRRKAAPKTSRAQAGCQAIVLR